VLIQNLNIQIFLHNTLAEFKKVAKKYGNTAHKLNKVVPTANEYDTQFALMIEVEDTGIGISEEMMTKLFTPFKQAQRHAGGTGLGLFSLAKRIEALDGKFGVRHRKDGKQGSVFWFSIPYRPDELQVKLYADSTFSTSFECDMKISVLENSDNNYDNNNNSYNNNNNSNDNNYINDNLKSKSIELATDIRKFDVLVVDDSLSVLKITAALLKRNGFNVEQAENGVEGLEKILFRK
jgi:CheY-like chemotaxis protein